MTVVLSLLGAAGLGLLLSAVGMYAGYRETHINHPSSLTAAERRRWRAAAPRWLRWLL
jgi:hypothetical protein